MIRVHEADSGTRTRDLLITNQLLYQLSHISVTNDIIVYFGEKIKFFLKFLFDNIFGKQRLKNILLKYEIQYCIIYNRLL